MADPTTSGDAQPSRLPAVPASGVGAGRRVWLVLGIVAALAAAAAVTGVLLLGDNGSDATGDERDPIAAANGTRLVAPQTLNGRQKIQDAEMQAVVEQMRGTVLSVVPGSITSEVGFYGNMTEQDLIMIVGVTAPIADPAGQLSNAFTSLGGSGVTVNEVEPVDAGPLGGQTACGSAMASGAELTVCGWADNGSLGLVLFYFTELADAKATFAQIRTEVEQR